MYILFGMYLFDTNVSIFESKKKIQIFKCLRKMYGFVEFYCVELVLTYCLFTEGGNEHIH